ncbi:hypothetical protein FE257_007147 [Aspergillus nanangensis]|uniref:Alpha/beta hydrolase fold-3 domain-containing protein n=1 Tax=Aspergillus nanangensis TaxID=2582783 RepID=A0AAD4CN81_ASPNN|nr:hypothetical protein FE257_007147 [Aspergillus nanangensis]
MSVGAVRNLSPEFIRDVLPNLPPKRDPNAPFSRESVAQGMAHIKQGKDHALATVWSELLEVSVENVQIKMRDGHVAELRVYTPEKITSSTLSKPVTYSLHGGGFVAGNNDTEDLINRQFCLVCDVVVFALDYRLAPEHPVITTIYEDVEDGLKWVYANAAQHGGDISKGLCLTGTSSGAAMCAMLGYRAPSLGVPIAGMVLRQPAFIFNTYEAAAKEEWKPLLKSREENHDAPILGGNDVINLNGLIAIPVEDLIKPENSPIYASKEQLAGMPPTYIVQAECDPMADEVALFHSLLKEAGVVTRLQMYNGMPHGFHAFHQLEAARQEMKDTAAGLSWLLTLSASS